MFTTLLFAKLMLRRTVPLPRELRYQLRIVKLVHCGRLAHQALYRPVITCVPFQNTQSSYLPSPSPTLSPNIYKSPKPSTKPVAQLPDRPADLSADSSPWQSHKISIHLLDFKPASKQRTQLVSGALQIPHCTVSTFED